MSANKIKNTKDLIMLLLYAKGHGGKLCQSIDGRTRLMKMIFLFGEEIKRVFNLNKKISETAFPSFEPYNYGPFSADVYVDLEFLVDLGYVQVRRKGEDENSDIAEVEEYRYWQASSGEVSEDGAVDHEEIFSLTKMGRSFVESEFLSEFSSDQWSILNKFKSRCTGIPLRALLRYVYTKYPAMATSSKIVDDILGDEASDG